MKALKQNNIPIAYWNEPIENIDILIWVREHFYPEAVLCHNDTEICSSLINGHKTLQITNIETVN